MNISNTNHQRNREGFQEQASKWLAKQHDKNNKKIMREQAINKGNESSIEKKDLKIEYGKN